MSYGPHEVAADVRPLYAKRWNKILPTADINWVIKLSASEKESHDNLAELRNVLALAPAPPRFCVEFPAENHRLFGTNAEGVWFAMARYDGHVDTDILCRGAWKRIGDAVLCFLEDLHRRHRIVHMDIKGENILVDRAERRFSVADFELMCPLDGGRLRDIQSDEYRWYYLGYGAELDQPIKTWRTDLVMLGYLLARLTWNYDFTWSARDACWRAEVRPTGEREIRELLIQRDNQLRAGAAPAVVAYMDQVDRLIGWGAQEPPPAEFYTALRETLRSGTLGTGGL